MKLKEKEEMKREKNLDKSKYGIDKGYIPIEGNLDNSNPPKGGSGVPSTSFDKEKGGK
ncbi:MAG: hypothetical protein U0586_14760 [Candidatus Brocadiaceae bacterium]